MADTRNAEDDDRSIVIGKKREIGPVVSKMSEYSRSGDSHRVEIERMTQTASEFPGGREGGGGVYVGRGGVGNRFGGAVRAATGASPSKSVGN